MRESLRSTSFAKNDSNTTSSADIQADRLLYSPEMRLPASNLRNRQQGQVLPLTIIFMIVLLLSVWMVYNSGIASIEKVRLQNTADASAYSSAVVVARDMNFIAYTNRAMVANQVAIGQVVGLTSWSHYERTIGENLSSAYSFMPFYLRWMFSILEPILRGVNTLLDLAITTITRILIPANDLAITGLSTAQINFHVWATLAAQHLSTDVTIANDPDVNQVTLFSDGHLASQIEKVIGMKPNIRPKVGSASGDDNDPAKRYNEFRNIIIQSEDKFLSNRSYSVDGTHFPWTYDGGYLPTGVFSWISAYWLRKYGGNEFLERIDTDGKLSYEWSAMDDISVYAKTCHLKFGFIYVKVVCNTNEHPLGYSATADITHDQPSRVYDFNGMYDKYYDKASDDAFQYDNNDAKWGSANANLMWGNNFSGNSSNNKKSNPISGNLAISSQSDGSASNLPGNFRGALRPFYDLKNNAVTTEGPSVLILVTKGEQFMPTQKTMTKEIANFSESQDMDIEEYGSFPKFQMAALAKAEPYFYRPSEYYESSGAPSCSTNTPCWARLTRPSWIGWSGGYAGGSYASANGISSAFEHGNLYNPFWQAHLVETTDQDRNAALLVQKVY